MATTWNLSFEDFCPSSYDASVSSNKTDRCIHGYGIPGIGGNRWLQSTKDYSASGLTGSSHLYDNPVSGHVACRSQRAQIFKHPHAPKGPVIFRVAQAADIGGE